MNSSDETQAESLDPLQPLQPVSAQPQPAPLNPAPQLREPQVDLNGPNFVDGQFHPLDPRNIAAKRTSSLILWGGFSLAILIGLGFLFFTSPRIDVFFWIAFIAGLVLVVATGLYSPVSYTHLTLPTIYSV